MNLEPKFIGDSSRSNNIMALAQQAKSRAAELDQQRTERNAVKKIVRQKYGW